MRRGRATTLLGRLVKPSDRRPRWEHDAAGPRRGRRRQAATLKKEASARPPHPPPNAARPK
eukprot:scaffold113489_cov21-Tisochrysis_lutea.AAC.1